ncbi:MAG: RNA polymerase subunit sigma-24 [Actinobacteria bacterium HGW-Actinobacteria-4]|nr:MAG: RNA polymerase subunit sigma-24 [Actinobacteria bacterium HGW-Actinobacteria-4]
MNTWKPLVESLLRERGPALFGYAYVLTGDKHAADDLVQDALVRTFQRGRGGYSIDQAHVYVKRAMLSAFIDGKRRAKARPELAGVEASGAVGDHADAVTAQVALRRAILSLPPRERACIVLRYLDDLPVEGVARELNIAPGTVKRYLSDALARLRESHPDLEDLNDMLSGGTHRVAVIDKENRS